ncbi:MAG: hypothetical protein ACE5HJ_02690 [Thermoplasmata archaeon]
MVGCPTCGAELTYIAPYGRHYCYGCRSYAPKTLHPCDRCGRALVFVQQYHRYYCYGCQEYKEDAGIRNPCPTCGKELEYIPQYDRFYCLDCRAYVPKSYGIARGRKGGKRMKAGGEGKAETIGYAPFSREEMDLASKEQLMKWCRDYALDDSGMKYELRLRLLEHVRKQGLLLKGEEPVESQEEKPPEPEEKEAAQEAPLVEEQPEPPEQLAEETHQGQVEVVQEVEAPQEAGREGESACPTCGGELTYIPQYDRWYCYSCRAYPPAGAVPGVTAQPMHQTRRRKATGAVKIRQQKEGNPMVGISLAVVGLLLFVAYALLYQAPGIFEVPVFITAPEIGFALWFLSLVFIALGLIAAIILVKPRG